MADRKLSIEDIAEPAKERVEFIVASLAADGLTIMLDRGVERVLRYSDLWTTHYPIVPSEENVDAMMFGMKGFGNSGRVAVCAGACQWQSRMYLKPKPELPEGVKAIMEDYGVMENGKTTEMVGKIVMLMQKESK